MQIAGLQKLTLIDYPGVTACTVFTAGCNFRCPYCHNAPLVLPENSLPLMGEDELLSFLAQRRRVLDGVVISGGEPLLHRELPGLLERIKQLGYLVKLDTNGSFPHRLRALLEGGLVDYVAMDIKNAPEHYAAAAGIPTVDLDAVEESKQLLLTGSLPYEFRTTVVKGLHTRESLISAGRWIAGARAYYLQQFKDSGALLAGVGLEAFTPEEMEAFADAVRAYVPSVLLRGL